MFISFAVNGEFHDMGIRMVSDLLSVHGWKTFYLGNNLPTPSLLKAIEHYNADMVGISVTMSYHVNQAISMIQAIRNSRFARPVKVLIGGKVFQMIRNCGAGREPIIMRREFMICKPTS